ncbi:MAG: VCBS repeat-containing protein [Cellvibrio sp.]|nr:VCBS repeat-containing protein [Cellvibrio sp.]
MKCNTIARLCLLLAGFMACQQAPAAEKQPRDLKTIIGLINQHCSVCHKVPSPALLPKQDWPYVIEIMGTFSHEKFGPDYLPKDVLTDITAYYYGSSPTELPKLPYNIESEKQPLFEVADIGITSKIPFISHIKRTNIFNKKNLEFLICDVEKKQITLLTKMQNDWKEQKIADIEIPIYTDVVDYDNDGDMDIIATNLGEFPPSKNMVGEVFLLRQTKNGTFEKQSLVKGIPRAIEARAVDVDSDQDIDLIVAAFGGKGIGEIFWLENQGNNKQIKHSLLNLSGALNITPTDLNKDGKMDFVSLISQEHEMIVAFIATENKQFKMQVLSRAPHPMFGSTGMQITDMDKDGDQDILFTNGDAFDTQMDPKPYHGVQWLENMGDLRFAFHDIGRSYGVAKAIAGDIDGDGDNDVVASSFINFWEDKNRASMVWFENDGHQNFKQHNLPSSPPGIVSFELGDFTGDGKIDILAGICRFDILKTLMSNNENAIKSVHQNKTSETRFILLRGK